MGYPKKFLITVLSTLEKSFDKARYGIRRKFGYWDPLRMLPFFGYGTQNKLFLKGRVLEEKRLAPSNKSNSRWKNFVNMIKRMESDEVPNAEILARYNGQEIGAVSDEEGYFDFEIDLKSPVNDGKIWHNIDLKLLKPDSKNGDLEDTGQVMIPPATAEYGIISDIDDTIIHSNVISRIRMFYIVFLKNAHTRLPFKGIAGFYKALQGGKTGKANNPIFYVSSGPWNLYDLLTEFFDFHKIPRGPILLRDIGLTPHFLIGESSHKHKTARIKLLLSLYPDLPFILIGDNGEQDPEIYTDIAKDCPGRIMTIYIRNVKKSKKRQQQLSDLAAEVRSVGSGLLVVDDTFEAANHAREHGWITDESMKLVKKEKEADEGSKVSMERKEAR